MSFFVKPLESGLKEMLFYGNIKIIAKAERGRKCGLF